MPLTFNVTSIISKMQRVKYLPIVLVSLWIRWYLMTSSTFAVISQRLAVSTPLNSWKRVKEAAYLLELNVTAYAGDQFHEPPHFLKLYQQLLIQLDDRVLKLLFITLDIVTCVIISMTGKHYLTRKFAYQQEELRLRVSEMEARQGKERECGSRDDEILGGGRTVISCTRVILQSRDLDLNPIYCTVAYLFNPFVVFSCAAQCTTVIGNLMNALLMLSLETRRYWYCVFLVALSASHSLYPITLLVPVLTMFGKGSWKSAIKIVIHVALGILSFVLLSRVFCSDWSFLKGVYTFAFTVDNLYPNVGLFWYFFTEMFEHFYELFIAAFQINALCLYVVPVGIRFRKDPVFMLMVLIMLNTVFKSYPSLGEIGFYIGCMPIWLKLVSLLQQTFLVNMVMFIGLVLLPIVWYLWIVLGTANANFLFGVTLCIAAAQIFLITDFCFAWVKQEFWLKNHGRVVHRQEALPLLKLLLEN